MSELEQMLKNDADLMLTDLQSIAESLDAGFDIDVRLCIDFDRSLPAWIIRSGSVDFDPRHSDLCGASSVSPNSNLNTVLADLTNQVLDQLAESREYNDAK